MAVMISEVYDAFVAAGAREDMARKAAETLAGFENRFAKIEPDLRCSSGWPAPTSHSPWPCWASWREAWCHSGENITMTAARHRFPKPGRPPETVRE